MSDNEFDDIMKAMPSNISKLDSVYMCFKDEHDKWCDSIKNAYAENNDKGMEELDWVRLHKGIEELGWVRLPVDADGVTIRVGDTLDGYGKTIEVVEMRYGRGGWVLISRDGSGYADTFAFAHRHEPTVEDVLREFADRVCNSGHQWGLDAADTIAEYSAKLRLAGEDE